jgi:bifunctional DNase/RNase
VEKVGYLDAQGVEGAVVLASLSDRHQKLTIRAFSGEVATHMNRFSKGDRSSLPTIYNIVEDVAERNGLHLARVQIYGSNGVLRGDISFEGRSNQTVLRGYRASDCVALAILYDAPILVQSSLLVLEESNE